MKETSKQTAQRRVFPLVVAIEFDPEKITAALVNENGRIVEKLESVITRRTTRAAAAGMTKLIVSLASSAARADSPIAAIGFSVAGSVDPATGRVSIPEAKDLTGLKSWTRVALLPMVEEGLNGAGIDVRSPPNEKRARADRRDSSNPAMVIQSRVAAITVGESWIGAAHGKNNVVYLSIGDEIEAGIVVDRKLVRGSGGFAGAAGWLALSETFKEGYSAHGCLTAEGASAPLIRRAIEGWDGSVKSMIGALIKDNAALLDDATIIRAARGADPLALNAIHETCRWIGRGVANLISILNPDVVVIGGDGGRALKPYLDEIRKEAVKWSMPASARQCRIVSATLGPEAALIGSARLAFLKGADQSIA